jgi:phenylacetate-CoA ligase
MQNIACSISGIRMKHERYNNCFKESFNFLKESEWWDYDQLRAYQKDQLCKIVQHAYASVPYYNDKFSKLKLYPGDLNDFEYFSRFPILTKNDIRMYNDELQSKAVKNSNRIKGKTGGTTGTALRLFYDKSTVPWQWATWWRHRNRFGINLDQPYIALAGRDVVPLNTMKPPFWRYNLPLNQTYISIHHMTKENMPILAEYICSRKVAYYSGYPSSLYLLGSYLKDNRIKLPDPPRMIFTGAETLLPHQREIIESAFNSTISDQYGASEYCCNISECEKFKYHIDMEFGLIELLPIEGMPDNVRRVIATGFKNFAMPLIRYDIGDIVTTSSEKCTCGRHSPVIEKIDGRIESYIITPDGRTLGRLDFLFKESKNIEEAQIIQNDLYCVNFKIVKNHHYDEMDEQRLIQAIKKYMGTSFNINIEYVNCITKGKNGKFRQIISTIFKDKLMEQTQLLNNTLEKPGI